jgi:hypothetical protein
LGVHFLLLDMVQIILTAGVGGVFIIGYATKDIFLTEENPRSDGLEFANDYEELMWLAARQRQHNDLAETRRFYQLRRNWAAMHSYRLA